MMFLGDKRGVSFKIVLMIEGWVKIIVKYRYGFYFVDRVF